MQLKPFLAGGVVPDSFIVIVNGDGQITFGIFLPNDVIIEKGFDFRYFTHVYKTKTGSVYYIVYDQAYLPKEGSSDAYLLVKFEEKQ